MVIAIVMSAKYNTQHTHEGKLRCVQMPMKTLEDGKQVWKKKLNA
jgi:hypothetical protein